jgi:GT2 family glycosyltransferase
MIPKVAIIMVNYNSIKYQDLLLKSIQSVLTQNYPNLTIWFIDNCSTDGSFEFVKDTFKNKLNYIRLNKNIGYGGACNQAFNNLSPDYKYTVFMNVDVVLHESCITKLIEVAESNDKIGALGPILLKLNSSEEVDSLGHYVDELGYTHEISHIIGLNLFKTRKTWDVFGILGAIFMVRNTAFKKIGGFYAPYFLQYDETDLFAKMKIHGFKNVIVTDAIAFHKRGSSLSQVPLLRTYLHSRNRFLFIYRNFPIPLYNIIMIKILIEAIRTILKSIINNELKIRVRAMIDILPRIWKPKHSRDNFSKKLFKQCVIPIPLYRVLLPSHLNKYYISKQIYNKVLNQ